MKTEKTIPGKVLGARFSPEHLEMLEHLRSTWGGTFKAMISDVITESVRRCYLEEKNRKNSQSHVDSV